MKDIGVAVVGAGFIGPVHVEGLRRAGVTVTGILGCRRRIEYGAANLGLPQAYRSFEEVLADASVRPSTSPRPIGCTLRWPGRRCRPAST